MGYGMSVCHLVVWQSVQSSLMDLLLVCSLAIACCPLGSVLWQGRLVTAKHKGAFQYPLPTEEWQPLRWLFF